MAQVAFTYESFAKPNWAAEQLTPEKLLPGGGRLVASAFARKDAVVITLAAGAVTSGSNKTLTTTAALTGPIPVGTILDFGSGEFAELTLGAALGATTITGVTLAADLEGGETDTYVGVGVRVVEAGTLVGRTRVERAAGTGYGAADVSTPDDELFLTANVVIDADINPDVTLLRHGTLIYEDKLPNWATLGATAQAVIRARYQCIASAA
jgi:hypothetical protein